MQQKGSQAIFRWHVKISHWNYSVCLQIDQQMTKLSLGLCKNCPLGVPQGHVHVYMHYRSVPIERTGRGPQNSCALKARRALNIYPIFSGPTNFYVYGSIRYCLHYVTVLLIFLELIFDPIKCVKYLEAIN